ncbi:acyl-CoA dehydrogenase family protein [candidate division KSB1 bacterium]|nr:acyl-CoA dehydrogenase family protein [candidate division KSB1 bacterium]
MDSIKYIERTQSMKTGGNFLTQQICTEEIFTREKFSPEQEEIAKTVEEFARERIRPNKQKIEKYNKDLSLQLLRECGELGLLSVDIPEKYDGLGLDKVTSAIVAETMGFGLCASFSATMGAHSGIGTLPIVFFGNDPQRGKYLPKLGTAELVSAYCLTEPESGSDALAAKSTAVLSEDGKNYVLNGTKQFITNASWADLFIIFANVDGKFTGFIVERTTPGLSIGPEEKKMGIKGSSTCTVYLENVHVPVENVLGEIGQGAAIAFNTLNIGRFKLGAGTLGACKAATEETLQYASERKQFGQSIRNFDVIKGYFADMVIRTFALDSIIYKTVGLIDQAVSEIDESSPTYNKEVAEAIERYAIEASICKVVGSETLWFVADKGLQIYGGYGFIEEYPMASVLRDNRIDRIFEGTNEINRQIISGYFLKKALMEELPIREKIKENGNGLAGMDDHLDVLSKEKRGIEAAKAAVLYVFNEAICKYGQDLPNEQQIGSLLSDLFSDIYLVDSVLKRVIQKFATSEVERNWLAIARVFSAEKFYEISSSCKKIISSILENKALENGLSDLDTFDKKMHLTTNVFELKRQVAENLYENN